MSAQPPQAAWTASSAEMSESGQVESSLPSALSTRLRSDFCLSWEARATCDMVTSILRGIAGARREPRRGIEPRSAAYEAAARPLSDRGNWCLRGGFEPPSHGLKGRFSAFELRRRVGRRGESRTHTSARFERAASAVGLPARNGRPDRIRTCILPIRGRVFVHRTAGRYW